MEVYDFKVVNGGLLEGFEQFQKQYTSPGFSHLSIIKLLEVWIVEQESVNVVIKFGYKYAILPHSAVDDLVQWVLDVREHFESEGRNILHSLQRKVIDQPPSPIV